MNLPLTSAGVIDDRRAIPDEGRVFVGDGFASLFQPVLDASGVELLAHENETASRSRFLLEERRSQKIQCFAGLRASRRHQIHHGDVPERPPRLRHRQKFRHLPVQQWYLHLSSLGT